LLALASSHLAQVEPPQRLPVIDALGWSGNSFASSFHLFHVSCAI
jgi:hypothetical protein